MLTNWGLNLTRLTEDGERISRARYPKDFRVRFPACSQTRTSESGG